MRERVRCGIPESRAWTIACRRYGEDGSVERRLRRGVREKRRRERDVTAVVVLDQSVLDGAPQCPSCWAHTMRQQGDGTFACPSGCPERVVLMRASVAERSGSGAPWSVRRYVSDRRTRVRTRRYAPTVITM